MNSSSEHHAVTIKSAPHRGALYFYAIGIFLFLLSWHLPYHIPPWVSFHHEVTAALALLAIATGVFCFSKVEKNIPLSAASLFLFCLIPIPLLQLIVGTYHFSSDAWLSMLYLTGLFIAFITGKQLTHEHDKETITVIFSWLLVTASLLSSFMALQQWLGNTGLGIWLMDQNPAVPPYANISQPNQLASLLLMGVVSLLYLYEKGRIKTFITAVTALLLFYCIVLTNSRTSFLSLLTISTLLFWYGSRIQLHIKKSTIVTWITVYILLWAALPAIYDILLLSPPGESGTLAEKTINDTRFPMWLGFLDASIHGPLLGYGWNQATYAQAVAAPFHAHTVAAQQTHNLVLDMLVWNGPLIGSLIILAVAWWILRLFREKLGRTRLFLILILVPLGIHSLLEYPHHYTYFLFPVGIIAGMLDNSSDLRRLSIPLLPLRVLLVLSFAVVGWLVMEYQSIESEFRAMRFEAMGYALRTETQIKPELVFTGQLAHFIQFAKSEAHEEMSEQELQEMEAVAHRYLYSPALFRYAIALGLNHKYDEARLELLCIRQLHIAKRYIEAIEGWKAMAKKYPQLNRVAIPESLPEKYGK